MSPLTLPSFFVCCFGVSRAKTQTSIGGYGEKGRAQISIGGYGGGAHWGGRGAEA